MLVDADLWLCVLDVAVLEGWRPRGKRLVAISNSGAACVMAADTATQAGLSIAKLSISCWDSISLTTVITTH